MLGYCLSLKLWCLVCQILPRQLQGVEWVWEAKRGESIRKGGAYLAQGGGGRKQNQVRTRVGAGQHQGLNSWRISLNLAPDRGSTRLCSTPQ